MQLAVSKGLWVQIKAKDGKESEVEQMLTGAIDAIQQEEGTTAWFAVKMGDSSFGIFDAFADDSGRDAHLNGEVAKALMGAVGDLIEEPEIDHNEILAAKLSE